MTKRNFLKSTVLTSIGLLIPVKNLLAGQTTLPVVDPESLEAKKVHFLLHKTAKNSAKGLLIERSKPFEKQFCKNCSFYRKTAAGIGECPVFKGRSVLDSSWCTAWIKRD